MSAIDAVKRKLGDRLRPDQQTYLLVHVLIFLAGLVIAQAGGPVLVAIGTSVSATGVAGWAIFLWVKASDKLGEDHARLSEMGIVTVFPARSVSIRPEYEERFNRARQQIDFLGFGLRALREDFLDQFASWLERVDLRVLLLDPDAPHRDWRYTTARDIEEDNPTGSIDSDVRAFVSGLLDLKDQYHDRLQVRLYRTIPAVNICRIDDEIFWGPYLLGVQSRNTPTFLVRRRGPMFSTLADHYDQMWSDARFSRDAYRQEATGAYASVLAASPTVS